MVLISAYDLDEVEDHQWNFRLCRIMPSLEDLHHAIRLRDKRKVKLLVSIPSINVNSSLRSCTALSLAVAQGKLEIVRILLENGANANKLSRDWNERIETPLFSACRLGHLEVARTLIANGADVTITDFHNHTPLWISTRERRRELVALLIESGADLNLADKWSQCPLYLATKYMGRSEIAKLLIQHGCKLDLVDIEGNGALYWSLVNHQLSIFQLLIYAGAHLNMKTRDYLSGRNLPADLRANRSFYDWLQVELRNPPSLLRLAANATRAQLSQLCQGKSIWKRVSELPISVEMKQFLVFHNYELDFPAE